MTASFNEFVNSLSPTLPLNTIAYDYWQDWLTGRPIDGGVMFENILRKLPLDGSIKSLQILDKFLDKLKIHISNEIMLQQNASYRNLLTFIAFYAGLTFCFNAQKSVNFLSFNQLTKIYPPLAKLIDDDFSYSIAVSCETVSNESQPFISIVVGQTTFFPLVAIIERLYPKRHISQNNAPFFGFIEPSLFESIQHLLKNVHQKPNQEVQDRQAYVENISENILLEKTIFKNSLSQNHHLTKNTTDIDNPFIDRKDTNHIENNHLSISTSNSITTTQYQQPNFDKMTYKNEEKFISAESTKNKNQQKYLKNPEKISLTVKKNTQFSKKSVTNSAEIQAQQPTVTIDKQQKRQVEITAALENPQIHKNLLNQRHSIIEKKQQTADIFSELQQDLQNIAFESSEKHESALMMYQKSQQILNKIMLSLNDFQKKYPNHPITLNEKQQMIVDKSLSLLQQAANQQLTDAMLFWALLQFRGYDSLGIAKNSQQALALLEKSAEKNDCRAEKLLSKLYFQGEIVPMNRELANYWLRQAELHGHPEAKKIQNQIQLAQILQDNRKDEIIYQKRLLWGGIILIISAVLIIIFVKT